MSQQPTAGTQETTAVRKTTSAAVKWTALRFVLLIGVMGFFADFTYEDSCSIIVHI